MKKRNLFELIKNELHAALGEAVTFGGVPGIPGQEQPNAVLDANGKVSVGKPVTMDDIQKNPALVNQLKQNGVTLNTQNPSASGTTTSTTDTSGVPPTPNTGTTPAGQQPIAASTADDQNAGLNESLDTNFQVGKSYKVKKSITKSLIPQQISILKKMLKNSGNNTLYINSIKDGYAEVSGWKGDSILGNLKVNLSDLVPGEVINESLNTPKMVLQENIMMSIYDTNKTVLYEEELGFLDIQAIANTPGNGYSTACRTFIQNLTFGSLAGKITSTLQAAGHLDGVSTEAFKNELKDAILKDSNKLFDGCVRGNLLHIFGTITIKGTPDLKVHVHLIYSMNGGLRDIQIEVEHAKTTAANAKKGMRSTTKTKEPKEPETLEDMQFDSKNNFLRPFNNTEEADKELIALTIAKGLVDNFPVPKDRLGDEKHLFEAKVAKPKETPAKKQTMFLNVDCKDDAAAKKGVKAIIKKFGGTYSKKVTKGDENNLFSSDDTSFKFMDVMKGNEAKKEIKKAFPKVKSWTEMIVHK